MKYSVCIPAVLGGKKIEAALKTVRETGYAYYEFWGWWDQDMDAYLAAQEKEHLSVAAFCTKADSLTDPSCRENYIRGLKETVEICHKLGCKKIISQVGAELEGVSREAQHASIVAGLKECISLLQEHDLTLMIEPLNTRIDHAGYYLWSAKEAFDIVDEVGDPHVKVLYDLYHQYVMDDLVLDEIVKNIDKIGHFHMAGYPGRHEPLVDSEVPYLEILQGIKDAGYQGYVGLEYVPVHDIETGLKDLIGQLP